VQVVSMNEGLWSKEQGFMARSTNDGPWSRDKGAWSGQNPHSPQVILEGAHKIDKKKRPPFEGEYNNVVMDSHMRRRLLNIHV
jgi:hypothetical protein